MDRGPMNAKRNRLVATLFLAAVWATSGPTAPAQTDNAQTALAPPAGYAAGWSVAVYKAGADLDHPQGDRLASFAAPAAGFDMASYRDATSNRLDFGIAYTASGVVNVAAAGQHRFVLNAGWTSESGATEAHCAFALAIDGTRVTAAQATVTPQADHTIADGTTDLQPGLHPAELRVACDQSLGTRFVVAISVKTPSDQDPRPLGPVDIVHPVEQKQGSETAAAPQPGQPTQPAAPVPPAQ